MWGFTKKGFISVVAYDPTKDRKKDSPFPKIAKKAGTHLLVRARIKADLDQLKAVVPSLVIDTDSGADYAYRAVVTRSQYKKFLVKTVDEIDYDSHFKEAARDNSPKVEGRYNAMMSVWTAMAKLQEIAPWSGGSRGWTSTYGSAKETGAIVEDPQQEFWDSLVTDHQSTYNRSSRAEQPQGAPTVEDFMADPGFYGGTNAWRTGSGPRSGFQVGDKVWGYAGQSLVTKVDARKGKSDLIQVKTPTTVGNGSKTATYVSNYLVPDLTDWLTAEVSAPPATAQDIDLDRVYDMILNDRSSKISESLFPRLTDEAFELVTRMQESNKEYSSALLDEFYSEVLWESSDADGKRQIAAEGTVARKYESEAQRILNEVAAEVASDAAGA